MRQLNLEVDLPSKRKSADGYRLCSVGPRLRVIFEGHATVCRIHADMNVSDTYIPNAMTLMSYLRTLLGKLSLEAPPLRSSRVAPQCHSTAPTTGTAVEKLDCR